MTGRANFFFALALASNIKAAASNHLKHCLQRKTEAVPRASFFFFEQLTVLIALKGIAYIVLGIFIHAEVLSK
jgi:hypothetical protein